MSRKVYWDGREQAWRRQAWLGNRLLAAFLAGWRRGRNK